LIAAFSFSALRKSLPADARCKSCGFLTPRPANLQIFFFSTVYFSKAVSLSAACIIKDQCAGFVLPPCQGSLISGPANHSMASFSGQVKMSSGDVFSRSVHLQSRIWQEISFQQFLTGPLLLNNMPSQTII